MADVARIAGVTRPAVSNWRRRHKDFPTPVRETGAASLFALPDIEKWLEVHRKKKVAGTVREAVAAALNSVRADVTITRAVEICMTVLGASVIKPYKAWADSDPFDIVRRATRVVDDHLAKTQRLVTLDDVEGASPLVSALPQLVRDYGVVAVAEALLAEATEQERATGWLATPHSLAELMVALAGELSGTVYDLTCGIGTKLLAVHRAAGTAPVQLVGDETESTAYQLAALRMIIHGVDATVRLRADRSDVWHGDIVFADPPFDRDHDSQSLERTTENIKYFGGRGFHVSPNTLLVRDGADMHTRRFLVGNGKVEAVIQLPPGLYAGAGVRPALWLLRPYEEAKSSSVLLIDASKAGTRRGSTVELGKQDIDAIVSIHRRWQDHGLPQKQELPAVAVAKEQLVAGQCRLDVESWVESGPNVHMSLARVQAARMALYGRFAALAKLPAPEPLTEGNVERRPIHELIYSGEAELFRGLRLTDLPAGSTPVIEPGGLGDGLLASATKKVELDTRRDTPVSRRGDIVISVDGPTVRAAVVTSDGAVVQAPLQCLRLRRASMARALTIAALLSAGLPSVPYAEVRDLVMRWPNEAECERIERTLDVVLNLRHAAAEIAEAADHLVSSTLSALAAGAVHDDGHRRSAVFQ